MKKVFWLSIRSLVRDWRSGELSVLAIALIIAVSGITTTNLFADRLNRTMAFQAAAFLAADMAVTSHSKLPESWLAKAMTYGLAVARTESFASVIMHGEKLLLCGVKAVSEGYPLRGNLKTTSGGLVEAVQVRSIPSAGEAWVDRRVLTTLDLSLGDDIEIGERLLTISRIITFEPDRKGNFYSLSPRVMINEADMESTGVIQPGSHVHYYFLFSGEQNNLFQFKTWLKKRLNSGQRIMDIYEDRPELGSALSRAERYLGLASTVVVVIAGVAIAMATRRYSRRHYDFTALLRCFGARQSEILRFFVIQILLIGLAASIVGCALGWFTQETLVYLLKGLLPQNLVGPGWLGLGFSLVMGQVILIGFSLAPILRQRYVSPLRVLRQDLDPTPISAWVVYGLAFVVVAILLWRYTEDYRLIFYALSIGFTAIVVLGGIAYLCLRASQHILPYLKLSWRIGVRNLSRHAALNIGQVLAFSITLMAMVVILIVRTDLLETWKKQLSPTTPNHFALNIFPSEWQRFQALLRDNGIETAGFYPIVRGRLNEVNSINVRELVEKESKAERMINRDFSLTYSDALPQDNRIVQGKWWEGDHPGQVSVEQDLAELLNINVGDRITLTFGSRRLRVHVTSLRSLRWDTMNPNFYMILSPGTLDAFPSTYLTSFYLSEQNKAVLTELVKVFPSVILLDIDLIIRQFNMIIAQVTLAIEYVLMFALLAGCTVLFAAVYTSMDQRLYEAGMLRTFGADSTLIRESQLSEFVSLGLLSGMVAAISAEILLWILYRLIFELPYALNWQIWLFTPLVGATLIALFGYWCAGKAVNQSPLIVINDL